MSAPAYILPSLVTIEDGDLLKPIAGHLSVKPIDGDPVLSPHERIGVVPSTQLIAHSGVSAVVQAFEQRAKEELPAPSECTPPPPPFSSPLPPSDIVSNEVEDKNPYAVPTAVPTHLASSSEEEEDIYQKIGIDRHREDEGLAEEEDDGLINDFDDDGGDENFTVHFAHHGRKEAGDRSHGSVDLLAQISELQEAVASIKSSLTEAVSRLGATAGDAAPPALPDFAEKCDANTAEVLKLVLALKEDFTSLKKNVSGISERQENLQRSVDLLMQDRRNSLHSRSHEGARCSDTRSNDSGVALLLERAHHAFSADRMSTSPAASTLHRTSDQDSLPEQPSLLVPSSVYDYVAGLSAGDHPSHPAMRQSLDGDAEEVNGYDSDSSLTLAANKSISLSTAISKELRADMTYPRKAPKQHNQCPKGTKMYGCSSPSCSTDSGGAVHRADSDGSDHSRDVLMQPHRRRKYEKISSSSSTGKLYGPLSRSVSQDSSPYQTISVFGGTANPFPASAPNHTYHHHRSDRDVHRCRVARELLETEKKYCRTLWIIQDTFAEPLKKAGLLSMKDVNTLFPPEVYQLYDKHCHLQHQLRERLASWQWQPMVGDILAKFTDHHHSDVLHLYTSYVNDFPGILKTFHKLCGSSPAFTTFIKSCLDQPACGGLDLCAFLLTPVQRIPRYILLLKHLLKYTQETDPDFHYVNVCLDRLKCFLDKLNDSIENSFKLVHATFGLNATLQTTSCCQTYGRVSRSPKRSPSTHEVSPNYSPNRMPHNRSEITDDTGHESRAAGTTSPKRSQSSVGGVTSKGLSAHKRRSKTANAPRSSSLPRAAPVSPDHSFDEPRTGKRPQKPLPTARSVADITAVEEDEDKEETKNESCCTEHAVNDSMPIDPHNSHWDVSNQSLHVSDNHYKCEANILDVNGQGCEEHHKQKKSLKSSLKNMFTFKKSHNHRAPPSSQTSVRTVPAHHLKTSHSHHFHHSHDHHHHSTAQHSRTGASRFVKEESDYWDPQTQTLECASSASASGTKLYRNATANHSSPDQPLSDLPPDQPAPPTTSTSTSAIYQPLSTVIPPPSISTPVPAHNPPAMSIVGDFVDEDGNPCSNV